MTSGGHRTLGLGTDELLSRLYQQLTEQQAAGFAEGYDIAAGRDRYLAWLGEHVAVGHAGRTASHPTAITAMPAVIAVGIGDVPATEADGYADAVIELFSLHYRSLVRLATLLVHDVGTAEEIVQDSFVAMHASRRRLADRDRALAYLRAAVVNRCRSVLRHRAVVDKLAPGVPASARGQITELEHPAVISALRMLPPRQREILVLRFYGDLSDAQIAAALGISNSAVKSHTARAMSALHAQLAKASPNAMASDEDAPSPP
jgi:RNA polymerase sigma-70 factor (sigma-E family)